MIKNPEPEIRNPKQTRNPKFEIQNNRTSVLRARTEEARQLLSSIHLDLFRIWDFSQSAFLIFLIAHLNLFRVSDFGFPASPG
jgi:hypothetical protein